MAKSIYADAAPSVSNKFDALKSVDHTNFFRFVGQIADQVEQDHHFLDHCASPWDLHRFHLIRAISRLELDLHITLTTRLGYSRSKMEDLVYALKCRINRRRLGRDWHKQADECLKGIAVFESAGGGNEHAHLVVRSPVDMTPEAFKNLIITIWTQLVDGAVCQVDPIYNAHGLLEYLTKEMWAGNETDSWKKMEDIRLLQKG